MIQAIETVYNGYRFRSRLEARWAVFFEELGIPYFYEYEGFTLPSGRYLPDFYMPEWDSWIEIKGKEPSRREKQLAHELSKFARRNVLIVAGIPSEPVKTLDGEVASMYQITGFIGNLKSGSWPQSQSWQEIERIRSMRTNLIQHGVKGVPRFKRNLSRVYALIEMDKTFYLNRYGKEHPHWQYGFVAMNPLVWCDEDNDIGVFYWGYMDLSYEIFSYTAEKWGILTCKMKLAYDAAKSARFEFGESG